MKHAWAFLVIFAVLLVPAAVGYSRPPVFYDFTKIFSSEGMDPSDMPFLEANEKLTEEFGVASTHMILADTNLEPKQARQMLQEVGNLDGVEQALGLDSLVGSAIPQELLPQEVVEILKGDRYQLMLVNSSYQVSTEECNRQIDAINAILKRYDPSAMLIGEAPCTKDLIEVTDLDFSVVSAISIVAIFVIIALVLKSVSLPVILVAVIEFAVFVNLGIPYYTGNALCFITPICISTIQLGATVDYSILLTNNYIAKRKLLPKKEACIEAVTRSCSSIFTSGTIITLAGYIVHFISTTAAIGDLGHLIGRGGLLSVMLVLTLLPALLVLCDPLIIEKDWKKPGRKIREHYGVRRHQFHERAERFRELGNRWKNERDV